MSLFTLKLKDSPVKIEYLMAKALREVVGETLKRARPFIQSKIRNLFRQEFLKSDTYISLTQGLLWHDFGIVGPAKRLEFILQTLLDYINVTINVGSGKSNLGGLSISLLDLSFENVIKLRGSIQTTEKGVELPWLEWLLLHGLEVIIKDYHIRRGPSKYSRTGDSIMIQKGRWSVPVEFAGTPSSNWLTILMDNLEDQIYKIIEEEIRRNI